MSQFEQDCYGGENGGAGDWQYWQNQNITNAYILIYEKEEKLPIELVFDSQENMDQHVETMNLDI